MRKVVKSASDGSFASSGKKPPPPPLFRAIKCCYITAELLICNKLRIE